MELNDTGEGTKATDLEVLYLEIICAYDKIELTFNNLELYTRGGGYSENILVGVLGAVTARRGACTAQKGGIRCGHNHKKGGS